MHSKPRLSVAAAVLLVLGLAASARAAESTQNTVVSVGEMCGGCVKRITAKLEPMSGVADVQCDVKKKTVTVVPHRGKVLSPRGLWEAMEEIGKAPKKLAGPSGTFTSKPKF